MLIVRNSIFLILSSYFNIISSFSEQTQLVGDMLCLGGTILFAVITVLQELIVKKIDCLEYLGMLGLFGSLICGIQMFLLEKTSLINANWENKIVLFYLAAYAVVQFIFFSLLSLVLKRSGSVAVHLYLLTTNFYSLIFGIIFMNYKVQHNLMIIL